MEWEFAESFRRNSIAWLAGSCELRGEMSSLLKETCQWALRAKKVMCDAKLREVDATLV
jgi:hypothetical protein